MGWFSKKKEDDLNRGMPDLPDLPEIPKNSSNRVLQINRPQEMPTEMPEVEIHEIPELPELPSPPIYHNNSYLNQPKRITYPASQEEQMQKSNFTDIPEQVLSSPPELQNPSNLQPLPNLPELPEINLLPEIEDQYMQNPSFNQNPLYKQSPNFYVPPESSNYQRQINPNLEKPLAVSLPPDQTIYPKQQENNFNQKKVEPIFIRIDKFESTVDAFEEIKSKITELDDLLSKSRELKQKEELELSEWEKEIQDIKLKLDSIDKGLLSELD
jgi:hypothetical protein